MKQKENIKDTERKKNDDPFRRKTDRMAKRSLFRVEASYTTIGERRRSQNVLYVVCKCEIVFYKHRCATFAPIVGVWSVNRTTCWLYVYVLRLHIRNEIRIFVNLAHTVAKWRCARKKHNIYGR